MKWSQFVVPIQLNETLILFNTDNKCVLSFTKTEYEKVKNFIKNESNKINDEVIKCLIDFEMIVNNDCNEKIKFLEKYKKHSELTETFDLTILPTTNCNFSCSYCYENDVSKQHLLNKSDITSIINFLNAQYLKFKFNNLNLLFFGGEPTLNWTFSESLMPYIKKYCDSHSINLKTNIISNGFLLNPSKVDFLMKYSLSDVQITLDGTKYIHDKRRCLKNGNGTFDNIITNIKYILDKTNATLKLRINYDLENMDNIPDLLIFLSMQLDSSKINLSFGSIESTVDSVKYPNIINENNTLKKCILKYYSLSNKLGFSIPDYIEFGNLCMAKRNLSAIISADKKIYKCLSLIGKSQDFLCNIDEHFPNLDTKLLFSKYDMCFEKECAYIPICHRGCKYSSLIKFNDAEKGICEYDRIRDTTLEYLKILYS